MLVVEDNTAARGSWPSAARLGGARTQVASLAAALAELRGAAYEAVLIDDPIPDGEGQGLLQQLPAASLVRPRFIRLVSFQPDTDVLERRPLVRCRGHQAAAPRAAARRTHQLQGPRG